MSYSHLSHRVKRSQNWSQDWSLPHWSWRSSLLSEHISRTESKHPKGSSVLVGCGGSRDHRSSMSLHLWSSNKNISTLVPRQTKDHGHNFIGDELSTWYSSWPRSDSSFSSTSFRHSLHEHCILLSCNYWDTFGHIFSQKKSTSNSTQCE